MVSVFSAADVIPKPIWSAKRSRKSVEATQAVRLIKTKLVCSFYAKDHLWEKRFHSFLGRQPSIFQAKRPVGKLLQFGVMSRHDNGFAISLQHLQYLLYFLYIRYIQISRWLISKNKHGIVRQGAGKRYALLFAPTQLGWKMICPRLQTHRLQQFYDARLYFRLDFSDLFHWKCNIFRYR
jgi:hypothetical protein